VPLAAGATALGVLALPPVGDALRRALGEASTPTAGPLELIGSALIALAVLGAVLRWPPPAPRWAAGWLGLEPAVHLLVVDPTCRLARAFARFDDRVLDRAVEQGALVTVALARRLGRIDVRGVDGAVESLARSTRRLGDLVRRSQTGQLHEYYVQTAALLAAGVVLLVLLG
jgi:hypothetical protein